MHVHVYVRAYMSICIHVVIYMLVETPVSAVPRFALNRIYEIHTAGELQLKSSVKSPTNMSCCKEHEEANLRISCTLALVSGSASEMRPLMCCLI